ncbi:hypothetical protein QWY82_11345 [Simiduia curdlanivorans]|uniref:Uncharacterized protein n=1 Tax=Simiduia curdlanivorans TaxID=1492769 RepID=A0ABV8VBZ8_9GAMM|nr:hypothetical protein [Simiduia curdlanivorans]MDN3639400.1 hypothetical protein [Simiduia curdlanivorans]
MSIILTDSQGQRYRLTHGWGSDTCSNKNLFRGPGQAQAFIGELAREQTTEIYQTFFGGTDHLPRHLCTPQVNVGVINGPSIFTQVRSNNDRIADAIERSQLIIEKDNSLQPVADDRAILRVKIKQALNEILIAERAETAKIDEEFQKLSYFGKDLALRWASLKGLGGAAWDLAKWIKEVNDLTSMQLRLYRYAKNAATASGTENFYDTFTSLNLDAELRELIDVLGFDPTKVSLDDIKKALDLADQVTSDGPLMRDIGIFIKDFALSQHRLEVAEFGGAAAFEIILTAILTALTGGVGLGVAIAIASKARLIRQFEKLGKLLSEFAIANKKVGKYLADKAKRGAKSVKRSFDDVKTDTPAQTKTDKPSSNKPKDKKDLSKNPGETRVIQARKRQNQMLLDNTGYNISPTAWDNYPTIGRNGTFISDSKGISDVIGDFNGKSSVSAAKVAELENAFGLEPGTLKEGFKIRKVDNIADKMTRSPLEGNQYFLGPGNHLPGGAPEIVIESIPTIDTKDVTTLAEITVK